VPCWEWHRRRKVRRILHGYINQASPDRNDWLETPSNPDPPLSKGGNPRRSLARCRHGRRAASQIAGAATLIAKHRCAQSTTALCDFAWNGRKNSLDWSSVKQLSQSTIRQICTPFPLVEFPRPVLTNASASSPPRHWRPSLRASVRLN
jgi:hypothetical protein